MFEVQFRTTTFAPPRTVAIQTPLNGWQTIEGAYADGTWRFALDETEVWTHPGWFKFVLDERFWMDDPYLRISPTAGGTYDYDETTVRFAMTSTAPPTTTPAVIPTAETVPAAAAGVPATVTATTATATATTATLLPELPVTEGAAINRVVILLTPFFTVGAAWVAGVLARHVPGVTLDQTQVVSFMIAIATVCLASSWKWLQGWQQHELLVAQRLAAPIKPVIGNMPLPRL